jgi:2-haloalkanoic acid dehalogenase, type II
LNPQAFIFDAYGTLFDVHSVIRNSGVGIPGNLEGLSKLWRRKQLEYTWLRALMDRYEDFWHITEVALRSAVRQLTIEATNQQLESLMQAYLVPEAFPEVVSALQAVKGLPLTILSNGSPAMLESAVHYNSLQSYFAEIISVDRVKTYKHSPRVYELGSKTLNLPAAEILFVSSNLWDAAGAKAFGYQVCWCNRSGAAIDDWGFAPDFTVSRLDQIGEALKTKLQR